MKTTIKSLRAEMFAGELTGKLVININGTIAGIQRNVDDDGVITFAIGEGNTIRMNWSAFSAQIRNAVDESFTAPINYYFDSSKDATTERRVALMNAVMAGATIEVEATELDVAETDEVAAHKAISYNITKVVLSKMAKLIVAQKFIAETMAVTGVKDQLLMAQMLFGIEL